MSFKKLKDIKPQAGETYASLYENGDILILEYCSTENDKNVKWRTSDLVETIKPKVVQLLNIYDGLKLLDKEGE